jgi:hypothetical protein
MQLNSLLLIHREKNYFFSRISLAVLPPIGDKISMKVGCGSGKKKRGKNREVEEMVILFWKAITSRRQMRLREWNDFFHIAANSTNKK